MKNQITSSARPSRPVFLALFLLIPALPLQAENWPAWRGPQASGVTTEKNLPVKWSAAENVRWKTPLPEPGNSTPIIWGNRIFITQAIDKEDKRTLMCLDRRDGKVLWQKGATWAEKEETHEDNPYCAASPVTDGERVIASFGSAGLYCYDLEGKELWHRELGRQSHIWGYASSPLIYRDLCVLYRGPDKQGFLAALDKRTGKTIWQVDEPPIKKRPRTDGFRGREDNSIVGSFSTPLLVRAQNRDELVMAYPQVVCAYDPQTGKELWRCDGLNELIYTSPIYGEGVVVVMGGFSGSLMGVKPGGNGNVTDTARVWREERAKKNYCGSGVISGGHIYLVNMEGFGQCIELKTGKLVWEERMKGTGPKSESWSSPVLVGDLVYVLNRSGETAIFKASPKFELVAMNSLGNELTNASHAISDGEIFIRTHEHLWCIKAGPQTAQVK